MDPNVLHNLSYGMYALSSNKGVLLNGQIANTVFQITSEPVTIGISVNNKNLTHEYIESSRHFSLSILDQRTPLSFIGKFGFRSGRKEVQRDVQGGRVYRCYRKSHVYSRIRTVWRPGNGKVRI